MTVNVVIKDETIWLSQKGMAELSGVKVPAISKHLGNIFTEGELLENATVSKMEIVQQEGKRRVKRQVERTVLMSFWLSDGMKYCLITARGEFRGRKH